jgi:hypothetical protein
VALIIILAAIVQATKPNGQWLFVAGARQARALVAGGNMPSAMSLHCVLAPRTFQSMA